MPQLDPVWFSSQLFWLMATFLLLYAITARAIVPLTAAVLKARKESISGDLDLAAEFRAEAEKLEASYKAGLEATHTEAAGLIAKAAADAEARAVKKHAELDAKLHEQTREAEKRIATAREKAKSDISALSSGIALDIVQRLTDIKLDRSKADSIVRQSLK